jgi:hypothetical protein
MKSFILIIALAFAAVFTSCQKETASYIEQWLLLEQNWSVTINQSSNATLEVLTPSGTMITGTEVTLAQLPNAIAQRLQDDGINLNSISEIWQINNGGYFLKVQAQGTINVYWFASATDLKSIGKVSS